MQSVPPAHGADAEAATVEAQEHVSGVQVQGWQLQRSVIGTSWVSGWRGLICSPVTGAALERKGYVTRNDAGATPNMRRKVRLRWAESEKPASCAAWVRDLPSAMH